MSHRISDSHGAPPSWPGRQARSFAIVSPTEKQGYQEATMAPKILVEKPLKKKKCTEPTVNSLQWHRQMTRM